MSMRWPSIALAVGLAGGVYAWVATGSETSEAAGGDAQAASNAASNEIVAENGRAPMRVVVLQSRAQPYERRVTLRGVAEAAREVGVSAETTGLVRNDPLPKGAEVAAGQVLCTLEIGDREAHLQEMRAKLTQAEADAEASEALSRRGFSADTTVAADAAALEAARAALARMEIDIARLEIRAPFAGRLEDDTAERGSLLQPGSICARVIALDPIRFVGHASERLVDGVALGAPVVATLVNGRQITATVSFVAASADPDTRTFRVEARAPNPDGRVRAGASATLSIATEAAAAHLTPHEAVTINDDGRVGVRLAVDGRAQFFPVVLLDDGPEGVWLGGLPDQASIIVVGHAFVRDGAPVEPVPMSGDEARLE